MQSAGPGVADDLPHHRHVVRFEAAPQRVDHELPCDRGGKHVRVLQQCIAKSVEPLELRPVREHAGCVDRQQGLVPRAPLTDRVEVLQREPRRVDHRMAARADRVRAVPCEALPHPEPDEVARAVLLQAGHVRRRLGRRGAENIVENPLAAQDGGRPVGARSHGQDACVTQQTAAARIRERHAAELVPVDFRNPVVPREALVHEGVVGCQQLEHAAVLAQDGFQQQLRFPAGCMPQAVVEVWKQRQVRTMGVEVAQHQPLSGEVLDQRVGTRIVQHPADLLIEHDRIRELAPLRHGEQLGVGNTAPEKERQA